MRESAGDEVVAVCPRKLMKHAQEGVEMGIGCREGSVAVLTHANSQTDDTDGSTTAVVAVMQPPKRVRGDRFQPTAVSSASKHF